MKQLTLFQSEDEHSNASLDTRSNANARSSGHGIFFHALLQGKCLSVKHGATI